MHPNKHIRKAMKYAAEQGFQVEERKGKGHVKYVLYCEPGCCRIPVYGTPRNPENHASDIHRAVDACAGRTRT